MSKTFQTETFFNHQQQQRGHVLFVIKLGDTYHVGMESNDIPRIAADDRTYLLTLHNPILTHINRAFSLVSWPQTDTNATDRHEPTAPAAVVAPVAEMEEDDVTLLQ